jgi:hypothetical protein
MNTRWLIGIGVAVVLLLIAGRMWWPGQPKTPVPAPELPQPARSDGPGQDDTGGVKSAAAPPAKPRITAPDPVVLALAERGQPGKPWTWARMSEVPPLDPVTQAELIRRCRALTSPTNGLPLVHLLALGGDAEAAGFLMEVVTRDYAGGVLSFGEIVGLGETLIRLGITARQNPEAVKFLEAASRPEFWTEVNLWKDAHHDLRERRRIMTGYALKGLAWSESTVADQVLGGFWADPNRAVELGVGGPVQTAAFTLSYVREHGLEKAVGSLLLTDLDSFMRALIAWEKTPAGREWRRWGDEVLAIETRRAQAQAPPAP